MLGWNKEMLKKKRFSIDQVNPSGKMDPNLTREAIIYASIDRMQVYFCKLFALLIKLKNNELDVSYFSTPKKQSIELQFPCDLGRREQLKLMYSLYRRIKMVLVNFENEGKLIEGLDEIFGGVGSEAELSLLQFFDLYCGRVMKQINIIFKQKLKQKQNQKWKQKQKQVEREAKQKMGQRKEKAAQPQSLQTYKNVSQMLCGSIYNILDLEQVESCFLLIDGAKELENINYVYDKIKIRNKKVKKQINRYYLECQQRNLENFRSRQQLKGGSYDWRNRAARRPSKVKGQRKGKKLSIQGIKGERVLNRTESKSVTKNTVVEKQRVKLQPIHTQKARLKLLR